MYLNCAKHEKLSLQKSPTLNEQWLQDRIAEEPGIVGLSDVQLLKREHHTQGDGRLKLLLLDNDVGRLYQAELQLGDTFPRHVIRCIEFSDREKLRYQSYEYVTASSAPQGKHP